MKILEAISTGELGYDGPLYDGLLAMTDDMLGFEFEFEFCFLSHANCG